MSPFALIVRQFGRVTYYTNRGPELWIWSEEKQKPLKINTTNDKGL